MFQHLVTSCLIVCWPDKWLFTKHFLILICIVFILKKTCPLSHLKAPLCIFKIIVYCLLVLFWKMFGWPPPPSTYLNVALIPYANSSDSLCQCLLNLDATLTKETFSRGWQTAITQYYDVKVWENLSLYCQRSCCIIMLLPFHCQNVDRNAMELAEFALLQIFGSCLTSCQSNRF